MKAQLEGTFENTLEDALAQSLRELLEANGRPLQIDYQRRDIALYQEHVRQWQRAKDVLKQYDEKRK